MGLPHCGILLGSDFLINMAEAIIGLLSNRDKAEQMRMVARKKVKQKFSVEKMIKETEKVYSSLVGNN